MKCDEPDLFSDLELQQNLFNTIQRSICEDYNMAWIIEVDATRLQLFHNIYMVSDITEEFNRKNLKNCMMGINYQALLVKTNQIFYFFCYLYKIVTIWFLIIVFFTERDTKDSDDDNNEDIQYQYWINDCYQTSIMITMKTEK